MCSSSFVPLQRPVDEAVQRAEEGSGDDEVHHPVEDVHVHLNGKNRKEGSLPRKAPRCACIGGRLLTCSSLHICCTEAHAAPGS